jgi:psp operon transcriptional activator
MNCAALPENLIEAELFGHEAGSFTGAAKTRHGRFEEADGGTLFLDELATLSSPAQDRLLRAVEYGEVTRIGASKPIQVDVRIVAATNENLPELVERGRFRADLLDQLEAYHWPGNVRELRNVVERAVYRSEDPERPVDTIQFDPFQSPWAPATTSPQAHDPQPQPRPQPWGESEPHHEAPAAAGADTTDFRAAVTEYERSLLESALARNRFNQRATAAALGLSYDQLRHALKRHKLQDSAA